MIIQTILLDPSRAVGTDEASNVSRPDPSGAIQADAKHPTRNRKVVGSNPTSGSKHTSEAIKQDERVQVEQAAATGAAERTSVILGLTLGGGTAAPIGALRVSTYRPKALADACVERHRRPPNGTSTTALL
jgi:hypothetical protein